MTARYRPGSRVAIVYAAFTSGGPSAAQQAGEELKLAASTLKAWIRGWQREAGAQPDAAPPTGAAPVKKNAPAPARGAARTLPKGRRVRYRGMARYIGIVMQEGPSQSVVRWELGDQYFTQSEMNSALIEVDENGKAVIQPKEKSE